jgi:hypothetical protein
VEEPGAIVVVVTEPPDVDDDEVAPPAPPAPPPVPPVVEGLDDEVDGDPPVDVVLDACEVAEPFAVPVEHDARTEAVNTTDTTDTSDTSARACARTSRMYRERTPLADGGLRS